MAAVSFSLAFYALVCAADYTIETLMERSKKEMRTSTFDRSRKRVLNLYNEERREIH